ncbi:MAG: type II toxin-antitoxin system RelE/ParE family toxin [Oscillospiraceae bacterium]|jgi:addiction module RelE/StbE family toxin|nr:type II toxin-antitoxin system RelE/ParE family toxin [Oscillospiraceae bacterium]
MRYTVELTALASADYTEIGRYIAQELSAPQAAQKLAALIKAELAKLGQNPFAYPKVRDDRLAALGYRLMMIKHYVVFFVINDASKTVVIERILYGRRDWLHIL